MTSTLSGLAKGKGKEKAIGAYPDSAHLQPVSYQVATDIITDSSGSDLAGSDTSSDSSDESDYSDSDSDIVTPEYLESLLDKARQNARAATSNISRGFGQQEGQEEDIVALDAEPEQQYVTSQKPLPGLISA